MGRGGARAERDGPERRCVITGETAPKEGLVRFVVGPDGVLCPDVTGKLPGRGLYATASRPILEKAARGPFARAARAPVTVPEGLADEVERLLAARVVELVSLGRKAGVAICGFEKVRDALAAHGEGRGRGAWARVRVLLQAADGSERGKAKLWTPEGARWFGCLRAAELGQAFGREAVIHAAVASGALAERVVEEAAKLRGLRQEDGGARVAP
ncbi:RNA-binding protein [Rubellimicrobium sp. CFH 75288]|uniref:RNA-binding protein n=1 Tax=Rubellimicrobium sp. CFH 75288 TaxID=2697034 RepID=UPI0014122F13|nr:RNA-binding protein [Rubellimicrobium sp. CFH 75288]NAZ37737.1 RNA-binding protein [Rubellimicrobium sp. CFH 75288]